MKHGAGSSRYISGWLLRTAMFTVVLLLAGCGEDEGPVCRPDVPAGRIQGTVRIGDVAPVGFVRATRIPGPAQSAGVIDVRPDIHGGYSMDVPAGRYVVALRMNDSQAVIYEHSARGLRYGDAPPDTILVDGERSPVTIDFNLASMHVHAALPPVLDGRYQGEVRLYRRGAPSLDQIRSYLGRAGGDISGGELDLRLSGILPGDYRVEVRAGEQHLWVPGVRDSAQSSWIAVPVDRTVEVELDLSGPPAAIEGMITGAWQELRSYEPPRVALFDPDSNLVVGPTLVADDGSYHINVLLPGPVKLMVTQNQVEQWFGGASFAEARVLTPSGGGIISGIDFVQSGLVLQGAGDLGSLWCYFHDPVDHHLLATFQTSWVPSGFIGIPNLRPGTYLVRIEPAQRGYAWWLGQWFDGALAPEDATPITISREGDVVSLPITIERGGVIRGTVRAAGTADGSLRENYWLFVTRAEHEAVWDHDMVGPRSPDFETLGVPDGAWKVGVFPSASYDDYPAQPPQGTVWYPGTTSWSAAETITIEDHAERNGVVIEIPAEARRSAR